MASGTRPSYEAGRTILSPTKRMSSSVTARPPRVARVSRLASLTFSAWFAFVSFARWLNTTRKDHRIMSEKITGILDEALSNHRAKETKANQAEKVKLAILETLATLGGLAVTDDDIRFVGDKIVLPASYEGRVPDAIDYLERYVKSQENLYSFSKTFKYRPWDGAHAFQSAMMEHFGTAGMGKTVHTFFGDYPPEYRTIDVGPNQQAQIPWGQVQFPPLEATFILNGVRDREFGTLFVLSVEAPKKYRKHIDAFFQLVENELKK